MASLNAESTRDKRKHAFHVVPGVSINTLQDMVDKIPAPKLSRINHPSQPIQNRKTFKTIIIFVGDMIKAVVMIPSMVINKDFRAFYDALQEKKEGGYRIWDMLFNAWIFIGCQIGAKLYIPSSGQETSSRQKTLDAFDPGTNYEQSGSGQSRQFKNKYFVDQALGLKAPLNGVNLYIIKLLRIYGRFHKSQISKFDKEGLIAKNSMISIEGFVDRVFQGNDIQYESFLETLDLGLPKNTSVFIRGSSVTGYTWRNGQAFDASGYASSDLDIVFMGEDILKMWDSKNFIIPLHYTKNFGRETSQSAPALDPLRKRLEFISGREVNVQAASKIYLKFRFFLSNEKYLKVLRKF